MYSIFSIFTALILFSACESNRQAELPPPDKLSAVVQIASTSSPTHTPTSSSQSTDDKYLFAALGNNALPGPMTRDKYLFAAWGNNALPGAMIAARGLGLIGVGYYNEETCAITTADQQGHWFMRLDSDSCFENGDLVRFVEHTGRWGSIRYDTGVEGREISLGSTSARLYEEKTWSLSIDWNRPVFVAWGKDAPANELIIVMHSSIDSTGPIDTNENGEWLHVIQLSGFDGSCPAPGTVDKHHMCHESALRVEAGGEETTFGSHTTYLPGEHAEMFFNKDRYTVHKIPVFVNLNWESFSSPPGDFFIGKMRSGRPFPGSNHVNGKNRVLRALTYADCSHTSALLGPAIAPATDISARIAGFGTGPCAGWFVMQSYSEKPSENPKHYVWIPGQSTMRISPETPAHEVMKLSPPEPESELQLTPLVNCNPVGFWQSNFYFGPFGYQNPMSKMEFHDDLSQVREGGDQGDSINRSGDAFRLITRYGEEDYWRGGFDYSNRNFAPPEARQPGWINHEAEHAFVWRYVTPDKIPTAEPNYGIQISGNGGFWTVYAELSNDCSHMRGSLVNKDDRAGEFWAGRMDPDEAKLILPFDSEEKWPSTHSETQMFSKDCTQALVRDWSGSVTEQLHGYNELLYHRVFLPDGYGLEWLLNSNGVYEFGINQGGDRPPELAIPFWWAIDEGRDLLLLKEFSDALLGEDGTPLEITERYELAGCHVLWGIQARMKYKQFDGELNDMWMSFGHDWVD